MRYLLTLILVGLPLSAMAQDPDYVLSFTEDRATPGNTITVKSLFDSVEGGDINGVGYSVCHDEDVLNLPDDGLLGLDGAAWDTTFCTRTVVDGGYIVGYLMNVITGAVIEPGEYEVLEAEYEILDDAETDTTTTIEYCTLGSPGVEPQVTVSGGVTPTTESVDITIDAPTPYLRGDCNDSGEINVIDVIYMLEGTFTGGPLSECMQSCDVNDEGGMDILDAIYLLEYLYLNGSAPEQPFDDGCGTTQAQTVDECEQYESCD